MTHDVPEPSSPATSPAGSTDPSLLYEPPAGAPLGGDGLAHRPGSNPAVASPAPLPVASTGVRERMWTVLGETKRRGPWQVPAHLAVTAIAGEARLDLREASLSGAVTTIQVTGALCEVRIIVPDSYRVECTGGAILGEFEDREAAPASPAPPDAPLIRVTGGVLLGEVRAYRTSAPVGEGRFAVDGMKGLRHRLRRRP